MPRDSRPVNLNLLAFRFPVTAVVSILHRISGMVIFVLLMPIVYWARSAALSEEDFVRMSNYGATFWGSAIIWTFSISLAFHVFAGMRHLVMDLGYWEELRSGRAGAWGVLVLSAAVAGTLAWEFIN